MLDLPFFLALNQPFIIVRKDNQNNFKVTEIGHLYTIPETIENCDLDNVNIVYYNGINHYQSVVLLQADQKTLMQELLRNEINSQIEAFIPRLIVKDVQDETKAKESADMLELLRLYPKAKREIIDRFKREYAMRAEQIEALNKTPNNQFTADLRTAVHGPIIEEVL